MDAVRKYMLYRPMVKGNHNILFSGSVTSDGKPETKVELLAETEHLACFIGGMVGMSSRIFNLKDDLDIAEKLTDGCVWAYGSMPSDIMPESAIVMPCESMEQCTWNETAYYNYLDPVGEDRDRKVEEYLQKKAAEKAEQEKEAAETAAKALASDESATAEAKAESAAKTEANPEKLNDVSRGRSNTTSGSIEKRTVAEPQKPLSHKEYVEDQIKTLQLPAGYVNIRGRSYILR
jgi:mannosyl-oligosaccharide alpha-1,2-mannosidase